MQSKRAKTEGEDDRKDNDKQYQDFPQTKRATTEGSYYRKGKRNNMLTFLNKRKAEANVINPTPRKKKRKAKSNSDSPLQGTGDIGK
eukprot:4791137-Heterocapsa_arctica.AAC.1